MQVSGPLPEQDMELCTAQQAADMLDNHQVMQVDQADDHRLAVNTDLNLQGAFTNYDDDWQGEAQLVGSQSESNQQFAISLMLQDVQQPSSP